MSQVTIYTKQNCPYCTMAKQLLANEGITELEELRIDEDEEIRDAMIKRTGRRTVPQLYIGEVHVGGYDDLAKLKQEGRLAELLKHN